MLFYLLLLFTVVPLTEFVLLSWLSGQVGLLSTIALVLVTGAIGAALAKQQGLATLMKIQQQTAQGKMPGDALLDGALILVAGAVLITPGMLTDAAGFGLLIPPIRAVVKQYLKWRFAKSVKVQVSGFSPNAQAPTADSNVIDAEVISTRVED